MQDLNRDKTVLLLGQDTHFYSKKRENIDQIKTNLRKEIIISINEGYNTFITDAQFGFAFLCIEVVSEIKKEYDIKLLSYVVSPKHHIPWSHPNKEKYTKMLDLCDEITIMYEKEHWKAKTTYNYLIENSHKFIYYRETNGNSLINNRNIDIAKSDCPISVNIYEYSLPVINVFRDAYSELSKADKIKLISRY